jgi:hypothetical protein
MVIVAKVCAWACESKSFGKVLRLCLTKRDPEVQASFLTARPPFPNVRDAVIGRRYPLAGS